jgi:hypothetical protein
VKFVIYIYKTLCVDVSLCGEAEHHKMPEKWHRFQFGLNGTLFSAYDLNGTTHSTSILMKMLMSGKSQANYSLLRAKSNPLEPENAVR